jgi:hypothetical protein
MKMFNLKTLIFGAAQKYQNLTKFEVLKFVLLTTIDVGF